MAIEVHLDVLAHLLGLVGRLLRLNELQGLHVQFLLDELRVQVLLGGAGAEHVELDALVLEGLQLLAAGVEVGAESADARLEFLLFGDSDAGGFEVHLGKLGEWSGVRRQAFL